MRIFHVALASEWRAAQGGSYYDRSTRGRSLAEVGFVHCSRADQWQRVRETVYGDVDEPLVLLTIDTDRLDAPVVEEPADPASADPAGRGERFPHVYGAVPLDAVVGVTPLRSPARGSGPITGPDAGPDAGPDGAADPAGGRSFSSLLMAEIGVRLGLAVAVMTLAVLVGTLAEAALGEGGGLLGALGALVLGIAAAVVAYRRWDRRTEG